MENINDYISSLRRDFSKETLDKTSVEKNPIKQFEKWFEEAISADLPDPNAMTLSTVSSDGKPSARVLLLKHFDDKGFVFYTNYLSRKGKDMECNPYVAMTFFWYELERQVRIEGRVEQVSASESDEYFQSRPRESKIGAWASSQSEELKDRAELEAKLKNLFEQYPDDNVPRPPHWGGYKLTPGTIEFWQGRPGRLHDRIMYIRQNGDWSVKRLSP